MTFTSATKLKDWVKNKSKQSGLEPTIVMRAYMMERFLERVSLSPYKENIILKGGFLISAIVGIGQRTTMDIDTTIKGLPINREQIEKIISEILAIDVGDNVTFEVLSIKNIHDISPYEDFRFSIRAWFSKLRSDMKIDITVGDTIIPSETEYPYTLMFENRSIPIMAYHLTTILAEKIETILSRNITTTRARDFYDVYILTTLNADSLSKQDLKHALLAKAEERNSLTAIGNWQHHLHEMKISPELQKLWGNYQREYSYAKNISFDNTLQAIEILLSI